MWTNIMQSVIASTFHWDNLHQLSFPEKIIMKFGDPQPSSHLPCFRYMHQNYFYHMGLLFSCNALPQRR